MAKPGHWQCTNAYCGRVYAEYINGCTRCYDEGLYYSVGFVIDADECLRTPGCICLGDGLFGMSCPVHDGSERERSAARVPDTSHVPRPDPKTFWTFQPGQTRIIGVDPDLTFRVDQVLPDRIVGTEVLDGQTVCGQLQMDTPVVISKSLEGEPMVTLTLRKIDQGVAYIQVTANPTIPVGLRQ